MAILKHIASKSGNYNEAFNYLVFEHDEHTGKQIIDEQGYPILREKYLIDGILCMPESFALECKRTNQRFHKNRKPEEIKSHHYIISFDPKDRELGLTTEKAQAMGMQFAREHFPGHQAIVATHDDGNRNHSGNIHVHIVINSVRAVEAEKLPYQARACDHLAGYKHNCTMPFLKYLQQEVTKMCVEQGYHQVDFHHADRRITNQEYAYVHSEQKKQEQANGGKPTKIETEKDKLRAAIDAAMAASVTEKEFREFLQEQYGIQVKESRGRWGYLLPEREKSIRARKLGDRYEKENVLKLLRENAKRQVENVQDIPHASLIVDAGSQNKLHYAILIPLPENMGRMIDIEHSDKIKNSPAYEQWAKVHNLQVQAEQFAFMTEHGLIRGEELEQEYQRVAADYTTVHGELKSVEVQIKMLNTDLRLLGQYYGTRNIWREYCRSGRADSYYQEHKDVIDLHDTVLKKLKEKYATNTFPDVKELKARKELLLKQKEELQAAHGKLLAVKRDLETMVQGRNEFVNSEKKIPHTEVDVTLE